MDIGNLYTFVLTLVLIGMICGVGLLVLDKFGAATYTVGVNCFQNSSGGTGAGTTTAGCGAAYNGTVATITALSDIPTTWLGLIVTVVVLAIILTLVIRSFAGGGAGSRQ